MIERNRTVTAIALAIYVLFGFLALAGRSWLQHRRTGNYGFRVFSGKPGSVEWIGWRLVALALLAGGAAPVADLWGVSQFRLLVPAPMRVVGLGLMLLGSVIALRAQLEMGASWRVGVDPAERTELITAGLFRWMRNPIFTAMLTVWFGLALAVPNFIAFVGLVASIVGIELQVRRIEEPYLIRVHGERYLSYARRVGRFVPGLGRMR